MEKKISNYKYNNWKKGAPKVSKDAAGLHMKVIVKKNGENAVTSIIITDKENPFFGKCIGDKVSIKGEAYKVVAIKSVQSLNAKAKKDKKLR